MATLCLTVAIDPSVVPSCCSPLDSRAEALATFQEAEAAHGRLVAAASAALDDAAGPDMATLRSLFGSGSTEGARFKARMGGLRYPHYFLAV